MTGGENADTMTVREGDLLWSPSEAFASASNMRHFITWLRDERSLSFSTYDELWRWSVANIEEFWAAIWAFYRIRSSAPYARVLNSRSMPGARWFEGARLNFAEHILRYAETAPDDVAFYHLSEIRPLNRTSLGDLRHQVIAMAIRLREYGIQPGDRIAGYMPNIPETAVAMLAATAVGAVWTSAAPEFGVSTVIDRFAQLRPKLLFAADGYRFGGKDFDRSGAVQEIVAALPSIERVIWFAYLNENAPPPSLPGCAAFNDLLAENGAAAETFAFEQVPSDHPLWVLFSSGTTGLPKAIVHSHAGILAELFMTTGLHFNLKPGDVQFFYTTTGWMMWNALLCCLLQGAAAVLYDGNPSHPDPWTLWRIAAATGTTCFGASPTFIQSMQKAGFSPKKEFDLSRLKSVVLAGSPATPIVFAWFYRHVKEDLWVTSQSGGTEICSGWVAASPLLPVYAGEIQARALGKNVRCWDDGGEELIDRVGELVVLDPAPSMPIYLWGDHDFSRYKESYFDRFPGVWRHGDFIRVNERGGCYVLGRSDSTLNRYGVRIGTAEIYRTLEQIDGIRDSLIVCVDRRDGGFFMPLFVHLQDGRALDESLRAEIVARLRSEASPRHVPDEIHQVDDIPYTLTGKKMEVPVRRILAGSRAADVASPDSMKNPWSLDWFVKFQKRQGDARSLPK